ncbi:hypothetical protein GMLC_29250 [Geomonas limicola]|uniref:DNA-binding protein n=1 Tax=Geomonas limicola TaxID=2740186 RepID=A0A6V8N9S6_9BACT|nr:DNA-binding protein [Geomonas limicola]GFO69346.1 hypothetical protein GMLC_29250 [Geomonas limicola]
MKRYSTLMSVLLTLALPIAATCADTPKEPEKPAASVDAVSDALKSSKQSKMMGALEANKGGGSNQNASGKVAETMNAGGYTYAKIVKDGKETWVAYNNRETRVGDHLEFDGCVEMQSFESKSLKRKFDSILFCGDPKVTSTTTGNQKSPGSAGAAAKAKGKVKVAKATGANAYTVSELFAKRSALNGKQVTVRGQVVKSASGIMNKNWIHLQDGTGSPKEKTNDLVVTTTDAVPADGEVVTVSGKVAAEKDFGSGYKYKVILEKGTIKK